MVSMAYERSRNMPIVKCLFAVARVIFDTKYDTANSVECFSLKPNCKSKEKSVFFKEIDYSVMHYFFQDF